MCTFASLCKHFFPVQIDIFFSVFCQGEFRKQPNFHILLILTGKNASKLLEWCIFRVWGMPNPMLTGFPVSAIGGSWKITISGKNFTFGWFWQGKMYQNGLNGVYLGFEACQMQCHRFWVSVISGSWKITISGKISHLVDFDWEKCIEIAWVVHI